MSESVTEKHITTDEQRFSVNICTPADVLLQTPVPTEFNEGLFILGAREPVPRYRHKMVLCSHFEFPICDLQRSLSYFAVADAFLKPELDSEKKAVDFPELTKIVCTHGPGAHFCARILAWVLEKRVCSH